MITKTTASPAPVLTKQAVQTLRAIMEKAIGPQLEALGYKLSVGNARFSSCAVDFKVNVAVIDKATGTAPDKWALAWKRANPDPRFLRAGQAIPGSVGTLYGVQYKFRGIMPRARRSSFVVENVMTGSLRRFGGNDIAQAVWK